MRHIRHFHTRVFSWVFTKWCLALLALMVLVSASIANASTPDKSEAPYFWVKSADAAIDSLPLKSTDVKVNVSGVIADVVVTQRYRNEGKAALDASYVFPGSTRSAVYGMQVRLGDRVIQAQIREKQKARAEFEQAKREGKTAALLEQHRPNVFQMNVANILPGDDVQVELRYTELLVPTAGEYEFVFPTVVGPRYASAAKPQQAGFAQAIAKIADEPTIKSKFDFEMAISSGLGQAQVSSTSHKLKTQTTAQTVSLDLADGETPNNRDVIVRYSFAGNSIQTGVLLHKSTNGGENFFLAQIEPPKAVKPTQVVPREYVFVVDISGSMHGFALDTAKVMMRELLDGLKPSDRFNVMLFSGSARVLSPTPLPATPERISEALAMLNQTMGSGGTEMLPAMRQVYALPKAADTSRNIVVISDGYVQVEAELFSLVRKNLSAANVFSFGIGSSVNRHLMEGLARAGEGEAFIITDPKEAKTSALRFRQVIESPVLTSVKAQFKGLEVYDLEPIALPDVLAERPVIIFGKWKGDVAAGAALQITGMSAGGAFDRTAIIVAGHAGEHAALRQLWARERIGALMDQDALSPDEKIKEDITSLGLQHSLLTPYTSFLAVDQVVRNTNAAANTAVRQPSPLPKGVGESAVGEPSNATGSLVPATPEPQSLGAMLVVLSMMAMLARRRAKHRAAHFTA